MPIMPGIANAKEPLISEELNGDQFEIVGGQVRIKRRKSVVSIQGRPGSVGNPGVWTVFPFLGIPEFPGAVVGGKFVVPEDGLWNLEFATILRENGTFGSTGNTNQSVNLRTKIQFPAGGILIDTEYGFKAISTDSSGGTFSVFGNTYTTLWLTAGTTYSIEMRTNDAKLQTTQEYLIGTSLKISRII
jgi:hypothetical protein